MSVTDLARLAAAQAVAIVSTLAWTWGVWAWLAAAHPFK